MAVTYPDQLADFPDTTVRPANEIVIQANPRGVFIEGIVDGTPRPGVCMQIKAGTAPVGGRLTYEVYNQAADGARHAILILLPNILQGQALALQDQDDLSDVGGVDTAFESGDRITMYCPAAGEEVGVRVAISGTGTDDHIDEGDELMLDDGTGLVIPATGGPAAIPFQATEAVRDVVATGTIVRCMYTGCC